MDEAVFLTSMAMFTILAGLCSIVFNKLKLPPLIGYLVSGIILANLWDIPEGGHTTVEILSDMGLVMLMFCIGLEINLKKIRKQGLFAMEVAIIQLPLMVLGGFIAGTFLGFNTVQCITLGAIISGSSTAVVMAVLKSQGKLDKEHIEMLVLITIMEDIGQVIILSMITPLLAGSSLDTSELIVMIVSIVVFMLVSIVVGLRLVPRVINWVSDNVSSEVLVVFSIGLAFGMALLSTYIGLSMAIGAFLMGMIVAASRKSKEINHDIEPMKNLFMAMFFISIGMEISLGTLYENITLIVIIYLLFAALKTSTVFLAYWIGNERAHTGFVSAIGLCAMGEFAFIIAKEALDMGVVSDSFYTSVIGAALISMIMLPLLTRASDGIWNTASEKCPQGLMDVFMRANDSRDNLYRRLMATSRKSRKSLRRNLTYAYMDIMLIVVVEIVFYFGLPYASDWLLGSFGGTAFMWDLILLIVNFLALSLPTYYLVNNAKYLDELVIAGAKLVTRREGLVDEPGRAYQKFLDFNTYMMVLTIDLAILIIVPNPLDSWFYILIFAAIALILVLVIYRKPWDKHEDDYDELVPAEDATDDEGAVQNTVSIKIDDTGK
ncbi:MAG: cation:proton antiporter [Candidatus Methanomethylophilaceae archaeon]|nr:cation:proton antiporter [Candidatus Methanomethylophilaceae archaeon]